MELYTAFSITPKIYGTAHVVIDDNSDYNTLYISDFDVAITNATAAEVEDVYVIAYGAQNRTTADYAINNGAPVVDTNVVIPDGMTVTIVNALVVAENGTITIQDGGEIAFQTGWKENTKLWVEGKVVDYDGGMAKYEPNTDQFIYEVKKTTETDTEEYVTYTTLKIALAEAQAGETINLHGQIVIDENLTIPEQVTVVTDVDDEDVAAITMVGATLTVNGTLEIKDGATVDLKTNADTNTKSDIVVNNIVANADGETFTYIDDAEYVVDGAYFTGTIGDYEAVQFITSAAVAGANSASASTDITIIGTVSIGDVAFTEGEENDDLNLIIAQGAEVTAGTVTLNDVDMSVIGTFTGTVIAPVTAGDVTLTFDEAYGLNIDIIPEDNGESVTTTVELNGISTVADGSGKAKLFGAVALTTGTATLDSDLVVDDLTVGQNATLVINQNVTLYVNGNGYNDDDTGILNQALVADKFPFDFQSKVADEAALTIDGNVTVKGTITWGPVVVNGTLTTEENSKMQVDVLLVNGTLTIAEGTQTVDADADIVSVALINGTVTGEITAVGVFAYPGSDVSAMELNMSGDESTSAPTAFYVNGDLKVTIYMDKTNKTYNIKQMLAFIDVDGVRYGTVAYYLDEAMTDQIDTDDVVKTYVGTVEAIYMSMEPSLVKGTVSAGTGLDLYIDNIKWDANYPNYPNLTVGEHTVSFSVKAGYDGTNATITFNGQTVQNGGTIEITQNGFTLVASGAVPQSFATGGDSGSDDGLGLTDYLLIILVILIVIMAIIVAMRLMRS